MKKTMNERFKEWRDKMSPDERHLYNVRKKLIQRCYDTHAKDYPRYGGRGIKVCPEWRQSWPAFRDWALSHGYQQGLEIDRRDNYGGYSPENCRFVTRKENMRNKRNNRPLTLHGETHLLIEWSELTGLSSMRICRRIDRDGWSVERALTTPVDKKKSHRRRHIEKEFEKSKQQQQVPEEGRIITSATSEEEVKAIEDMQKALLLPFEDDPIDDKKF